MKTVVKALIVATLGIHAGGALGDATDASPSKYHPGREKALPGVESDHNFSNTYSHWKDREAIEQSIADGLSDEVMNYKNIRWLKRDDFNGDLLFEEAKVLFAKAGPKGKSCASCHGDQGKKLEGVAAQYPKFDNKLGRMVSLTTRIKICGTEHVGVDLPVTSGDNNLLEAYITSLSHGLPVQVDVSSGPQKESFERGRNSFFKRTGQFNFACASCHTPPTVLKKLRGMRPSTPYGDAASYPIFEFPDFPERHYLVTLQHQIQACAFLARMKTEEEGSPEYTDIEVFLRALANGYEVNALSSYYGEALD